MMKLALGHVAIAIVCAALLLIPATPIGGVHPALKPLKFALSIALLLGTVAIMLRYARTTDIASWVLGIALSVEMIAIVVQALRGQPSHWNTSTFVNAAIWRVMGAGVIVAMVALLAIAFELSTKPLALPPVIAFGIRAGLWLMFLAAISGVAMGGRGQHTVGGPDGGAGIPITSWSRSHGDLRIPHFIALHSIQAIPLLAALSTRLSANAIAQWTITIVGIVVWIGVAIITLVQALAGRPW
ncbi:MAG: hypothetical protein QM831_12865 [Kofleriaceae bacterium]